MSKQALNTIPEFFTKAEAGNKKQKENEREEEAYEWNEEMGDRKETWEMNMGRGDGRREVYYSINSYQQELVSISMERWKIECSGVDQLCTRKTESAS